MKRSAPLWLLVCLLVLAGCGGGAKKSSSNTTGGLATAARPTAPDSSSRGQLIARAEVICRQLNTALSTNAPASQTVAEIVRKGPARAALEQRAVRELRRLTPTASIAGAWRRVLGYRRTLANELAQLVGYARRNDLAGIKSLAVSKQHAHRALYQVATHAGFKACAVVA